MCVYTVRAYDTVIPFDLSGKRHHSLVNMNSNTEYKVSIYTILGTVWGQSFTVVLIVIFSGSQRSRAPSTVNMMVYSAGPRMSKWERSKNVPQTLYFSITGKARKVCEM